MNNQDALKRTNHVRIQRSVSRLSEVSSVTAKDLFHDRLPSRKVPNRLFLSTPSATTTIRELQQSQRNLHLLRLHLPLSALRLPRTWATRHLFGTSHRTTIPVLSRSRGHQDGTRTDSEVDTALDGLEKSSQLHGEETGGIIGQITLHYRKRQ